MRTKKIIKNIIENTLENPEEINDFSKSIKEICKGINKKLSGKGGSAHILSDQNSPTLIKYFISTGSIVLDTIIANKADGGLPCPKIVEIFGPPQSGKSLIAAHALASTQKMGGLAIYIDTESAVNQDFLTTIGVDIDKLIWLQIPTVEGIFETIESIVTEAREKINPPFITIVWDSVAGASDDTEMEGDYAASGYGMAKAKMMSKGFRKITNFISNNNVLLFCTNQIRDNLGASYGAPAQDSGGGWALKFYSSLRLGVKKVSPIKHKIKLGDKEVDEVIGITTRVKVEKSRVAPPQRECILKVYFSKGIDDKDSWFDVLVAHQVIEKPTTQSYLLKLDDGREFKFRKDDWRTLVKENNLLPIIKDLVIKAHIVEYKKFEDDEWGEDFVIPAKFQEPKAEVEDLEEDSKMIAAEEEEK